MRPIVWGFIVTVVGAFFWIVFSVVFGIGAWLSMTTEEFRAGAQPTISPFQMALITISFLAMLFSLPISGIVEFMNWRRRRKALTTMPAVADIRYCISCGSQVPIGAIFCPGCGRRQLE